MRGSAVGALVALAVAAMAGPAAAQLAGKEIHLGAGWSADHRFGLARHRDEAGGRAGGRREERRRRHPRRQDRGRRGPTDGADAAKGEAAAEHFCDDPATLGVVGHANSGSVSIAASAVYAGCGSSC